MWVNASLTPSARSAAGPDLVDAGVLRTVDVARQQHGPLHPRVAQHLQRRRPVVRDRCPDGLAADGDAVDRCAPRRPGTPRAAPGRPGSAASACSQPRSAPALVEPVGRLRAGARPAAWPPAGSRPRRRKPAPRRDAVIELVPGARHAGGASTVFIRALSRTLSAVGTSMPSMPSASRTWASGTWSCSSAPTRRSTLPIWPPRPVTASAIWRGSSASSTRQCPASCSLSCGGQPFRGLGRDQPQADTRQPRGRADEPRGGLEQVWRDERCDNHARDVTRPGRPRTRADAVREDRAVSAAGLACRS